MTTPPTQPMAARWALRFSALAPVVVVAALVIGFLDPHGGETLLAAASLAVAFLAVGFGLGGAFLAALAVEKVPGFVRPRWLLPCSIAGVVGGFLGGILGVIT